MHYWFDGSWVGISITLWSLWSVLTCFTVSLRTWLFLVAINFALRTSQMRLANSKMQYIQTIGISCEDMHPYRIDIFVFCITNFIWNQLFWRSVNTNIWIWPPPPIIDLPPSLYLILLCGLLALQLRTFNAILVGVQCVQYLPILIAGLIKLCFITIRHCVGVFLLASFRRSGRTSHPIIPVNTLIQSIEQIRNTDGKRFWKTSSSLLFYL
jgi:hypothetical protein